jgi:hypothetical protein
MCIRLEEKTVIIEHFEFQPCCPVQVGLKVYSDFRSYKMYVDPKIFLLKLDAV